MTERDPFAGADALTPPKVEKRPQKVVRHGRETVDNYAWLRDENWREVLRDPSKLDGDIRAVLEAENEYYEAITSDLEDLRKKIFKEMRGRIKEDDSSVPAKDGKWKYWTRFREGGNYPIFMRARAGGAEEQTLYDGDKEGEGSKFFSIGDIAHSPDHKLIACAVDRLGSEYFTITTRNIKTGKESKETIESADGGGVVWTADSKSFYYIERDDSQRPKRVKLHRLGDDPAKDKLIYEEPDDGFFLDIHESQSREYMFIRSGSHTTSEVRFLPLGKPGAKPVVIEPRIKDVEYSADHHGKDFYILTNADGAVDFKIVKAPVKSPGKKNWKDVIPHKAGTQIITFVPYRKFFVRLERRDALARMVVSTYKGGEHVVAFDEAAYALGLDAGYEYDTTVTRFIYSSPSTPRQTFDYDMKTRKRTLLKTEEVPSGHDPSRYVVERITAKGTDGADIPVTILRLKETPKNGTAPALLYGYGSYGYATPAGFSTSILSLVDRGFVYALAHIRGGADKGRQWYLDGKREKKTNSFTDFAAAADALIENRYSAKKKIVIYGGSAGGLLVGATVNLHPDLFAGVMAAVPFVDVMNTISDASLPLTPPEWDEWGNPIESEEHHQWIAEYSPYENIKHVEYPPVMATGGLTDYRVTYWEPAKWIARLRDDAKGGPFMLRMNMGAGHAGSAARFERLDELAHLYAFALKACGVENREPVK